MESDPHHLTNRPAVKKQRLQKLMMTCVMGPSLCIRSFTCAHIIAPSLHSGQAQHARAHALQALYSRLSYQFSEDAFVGAACTSKSILPARSATHRQDERGQPPTCTRRHTTLHQAYHHPSRIHRQEEKGQPHQQPPGRSPSPPPHTLFPFSYYPRPQALQQSCLHIKVVRARLCAHIHGRAHKVIYRERI